MKRLDTEAAVAICNLGEAHATAHFMLVQSGSKAYELYSESVGTIANGVKAFEYLLEIEASPPLAWSKKEWEHLAKSAARESHHLLSSTVKQLNKRFGPDAGELYEYSRNVHYHLWFSMMKPDILGAGLRRELEDRAARYGSSRKVVETFISRPNPRRKHNLMVQAVKFFTRPMVFFSYAHEDRAFIRQLVTVFEVPLARVWLDEKSIKASESISEKVETGLINADHFLLVISRASVDSSWVQREYRTALSLQLESGKPAIMPLLLEVVKLPVLLRDVKYANFTESVEQGMEELFVGLGFKPPEV